MICFSRKHASSSLKSLPARLRLLIVGMITHKTKKKKREQVGVERRREERDNEKRGGHMDIRFDVGCGRPEVS